VKKKGAISNNKVVREKEKIMSFGFVNVRNTLRVRRRGREVGPRRGSALKNEHRCCGVFRINQKKRDFGSRRLEGLEGGIPNSIVTLDG